MAEQQKNLLQQVIDGLPGWKASFDQLRERIGWPGAVLVCVAGGAFLIWLNWGWIRKLSGIQQFIEWFKQWWLPPPRGPGGSP